MRRKRFAAGFTVAVVLALLVTVVGPLRAAALQVFGMVSCGSTSACMGGSNTSTGPGVQGSSAQGSGVVGQTRFNSTQANGQTGVQGQDISTMGRSNSGLAGVSTRGYGVSGSSSSGVAILGKSSGGAGVVGTAVPGTNFPNSIGVLGIGAEGVEGSDTGQKSSVALIAKGHGGNLISAENRSGSNVFRLQDDGTPTFTGTVNVGSLEVGSPSTPFSYLIGVGTTIGIEGAVPGPCSSQIVCAGVEGQNSSNSNSVAVLANGSNPGSYSFVGNNSASQDVFTVDVAGNVHAHSFTADLSASQASSNGSRLTTYAPAARSRTIEDFGEATLVGGQAHVPLDSVFAAGMDHSRPYLVFITPQGPVGGSLYVSQRTSSGFTVRETVVAARSNVAFDYRITARPYANPDAPSSTSHPTRPLPFVRKSLTIPPPI